MNEHISILIILEFVAPFALVSIILILLLIKWNKKNKQSLNQLLLGVQQSEEKYRQGLIDFLKKTGLSDNDLEDSVHLFTKNRREFFKLLLTSLTRNDGDLTQSIGPKFTETINHYHQLDIQLIPDEPDEAEIDEKTEQDEAEIKVFKRENKRLKAEVHVSVSALNSLFKEYASMFGEVPGKKQDMSVQQILEAMEKFTKGEFKPDNISQDLPPEMQTQNNSTEMKQTQTVSVEAEAEIEVTNEQAVDDNPAADTQVQEQLENEPNWDEAFEEVESAETTPPHDKLHSTHSEIGEKSATEAIETTEDTEPNWDEAFKESGDIIDNTTKSGTADQKD